MASNDRKPFLTATVLDQDFLDTCHDNLVNDLELIVDIQDPQGGTIHVSDRNKYVGGTYYAARLQFPVITRTVGDFLSPQLEFSSITLELNNADGFFNEFLPAGADFDGWIGNTVVVKLGLRDVASTYKTIFSGRITEEGGFQRSIKSITFIARDDFDKLNQSFPKTILTDAFTDIEASKLNTVVPYIYGDWTVNVEPLLASIPAIPVNGADPDVNGDSSFSTAVQLVISENDNTYFDDTQVYLRRGDNAWLIDSTDIVSISAGKNSFSITQGNTMTAITADAVDEAFEYASGDEFLVKVKGKDLGVYDDNIVEQARDILLTFTDAVSGDFASNWNTFRDKASPTVSAINTFKSRIWIQEPADTLTYVLSLFEQVRLEVFLNRDQKLEILSNHLDDFVANPSFQIKNWDVVKDTFTPKLDERNNFNRSKGQFNGLPNRKGELFQETPVFRATAAIAQTGREISKRVLFPNLYDETVVINQVKEILRIAGGYIENVNVELTWRSMLLDIGDFVKLNVNIQGTVFENVPALIRQIGYDPQGIKIPMKLWSFQMLPFPGHSPGFPGITGGSSVSIDEEV